jgi:hypothetical protein
VKKYVESFQHPSGSSVSSIDMTGEIKDVIPDSTIEEGWATSNPPNDVNFSQSTTFSADNSSTQESQSSSSNFYRQQNSKPQHAIGRIRHQYPSASTTAGVMSSSTVKNTPPPVRTLSDGSSSDDELIIHKQMDGSFPSLNNTAAIDNDRGQATGVEPSRSSPSKGTESNQQGNSEIGVQSLSSKDNQSSVGSTNASSSHLPANTSTSSSAEAWNRVVEAQSDINTSQEDSVSSSTSPPSSITTSKQPVSYNVSSSAFVPVGKFDGNNCW